MQKTIRLNSYPDRVRADEEANAVKLAFEGHRLSRDPSFSVAAQPYQGEYHVYVTADLDTAEAGFLSMIVARQLAGYFRMPAAQRPVLEPPRREEPAHIPARPTRMLPPAAPRRLR